jgi:hypothetical protein
MIMKNPSNVILTLIIALFCLTNQKLNSQNNNAQKLKTNGYYFSLHKDYSLQYKDTIRSINPVIIYKNNKIIDLNYYGNSNKKKVKRISKNQKCILKPFSDHNEALKFFECSLSQKKIKLFYRDTKLIVKENIIKIQYYSEGKLFREKRGIILNENKFLINRILNYDAKTSQKAHIIYYFKEFNVPEKSKFIFKSNRGRISHTIRVTNVYE